jgi:hypothetical protein
MNAAPPLPAAAPVSTRAALPIRGLASPRSDETLFAQKSLRESVNTCNASMVFTVAEGRKQLLDALAHYDKITKRR